MLRSKDKKIEKDNHKIFTWKNVREKGKIKSQNMKREGEKQRKERRLIEKV